ncbi:MAG: fumarylacetoacetate hydrolase family protein [Candidatus Lambdaproteobacteria bacterium]|nr:fumarylacetoacetate hydrolase family protein [Candidatus Lambdaproteobacteria bacterium]
MGVREATEAIWEATQQGIYYPPEWKGKLTVEEGYQVQLGILERHLKAGQRQAGWKVGLTAKDIRQQLGYDEPILGFLLESAAKASGAVLRVEELVAPCFENELCVTLAKPLKGPGVTAERAREAIGAVAPALEIVERRGDFAADPALAMADNVQQKYFVTGTPVPYSPQALDLRKVISAVFINGERVGGATGEAVLGDPAASLAWLANRLADFGRRIERGMRVMTGSFTRQFPIANGDLIEARFHPIGAVSAEFR